MTDKMHELFGYTPDVLNISEAERNKLRELDVKTIQQLVRMTIGEANNLLGRSLYTRVLYALKPFGLGFEMSEEEIAHWKPSR